MDKKVLSWRQVLRAVWAVVFGFGFIVFLSNVPQRHVPLWVYVAVVCMFCGWALGLVNEHTDE